MRSEWALTDLTGNAMRDERQALTRYTKSHIQFRNTPLLYERRFLLYLEEGK
jgi:hypothetical protein